MGILRVNINSKKSILKIGLNQEMYEVRWINKRFLTNTWKRVSLVLFAFILTFILVITIVPTFAHRPKNPEIPGLKNTSENAKTLLEKGRNLFEEERFAEAAIAWEEAATLFTNQNDSLNQAWSLSYLSLAYQNLGQWDKAKDSINRSIQLLKRLAKENKDSPRILAVALNAQGSLSMEIGQTENALKSWQDAEHAYHIVSDKFGVLGSKINQVQALDTLGEYKRANYLLNNIQKELKNQPDSPLKVKALINFGILHQITGDIQKSQEILEQSLVISQKLKDEVLESEILFNLGNTTRNLAQKDIALNYYQQAAKSKNYDIHIEAKLNLLSLYLETSKNELAKTIFPSLISELASLSPSRSSVYAAVHLSQSLSKLGEYQESAKILSHAAQVAENLGDIRAKAYSLNYLGKLYEDTQQLDESLKLTKKALEVSENIAAFDIAYQAYWQEGRILKSQGKNQDAINSYGAAVKTLKYIRADLAGINRDVQFSFREAVEPVYRQFVELLLDSNPSQDNLQQARQVIEELQMAELDNFFRESCLRGKPEQIDSIDKNAAIIYPIILGERLQVILSLPNKQLVTYYIKINKEEIDKSLKKMRQSLNPAFSNEERIQVYQQLYDWLIRPGESELVNSGIKTLVFVLDGSLRNLPMAALYDGKQYLVEKYNVALSPGLQLMQSQDLRRKKYHMITAGLSESRQGFKALPGVKSEVTEITKELSSKLLLNEAFTDKNLQAAIKSTPFSVLHLATHGQFSSKSEDTFILTWDGKINVKELNDLLQFRNEQQSKPLELMVLSACQTAKGDNRAILGLAGVAIRSGARSTLATLWAVQDESTAKFMVKFYKYLSSPNITKAEALRLTQIDFLQNPDYQHPYYWAPFVLIGNWL
jgi:CHAT domain-containing protein